MNSYELIKAIQEKINSPRRWCRKANARDHYGEPTSPTEPGAVSFCILGAAWAIVPDEPTRYGLLGPLEFYLGGDIAKANDKDNVNWQSIQIALDFAALAIKEEA